MLPTMVLLVLLLGHIIFAYILYRQMLVRKVSINPMDTHSHTSLFGACGGNHFLLVDV